MTLKEKFEPYVIRYTQDDVVGYLPEEVPILEYQEECEKIAEEFAINFANWYEFMLRQNDNLNERFTPKELIEMFKKEKGL
jgi:hypothetical protein